MSKHERITTVDYRPDLEQKSRRKRVAAYARVSGDRDEAAHSLSAQISYFNSLIAAHQDWEFVEIFADRGITGTKDNRPEFQRMLSACREGKIEILSCKLIQCFADHSRETPWNQALWKTA